MIRFILDTGAPVTLMKEDLWDQVSTAETVQPWTGPPLVGVEGTPLQVRGCAEITEYRKQNLQAKSCGC